jgi:hypothetical protein
MQLHPVIGTTISLTNANYARHFRAGQSQRPRYVADPEDLAALQVVSAVPASEAINTAVAQLIAPPRRRSTTSG